MNKTKRNLELAASIISIIISAYSLFILFIIVGNLDNIASNPGDFGLSQEQGQLIADNPQIATVFYIFIAYMLAIVIIASILCAKPKFDSRTCQYKNRFGLGLTLVILLGIAALSVLFTGSLLLGLILAVPCGLMIGSISKKHDEYAVANNSQMFNPNAYGGPGSMFKPNIELKPKEEEKPASENSEENTDQQ